MDLPGSQEILLLDESPRDAAMSETTLTFALSGDIPLDLFAEAMQRFRRLIGALTHEVSGQAGIVWVVDDLSGGSTLATIRGEAEQDEDVERVVRAYASVGRALERSEAVPYSPRVVRAAESIRQMLNGKITSIQFEAMSEVATVASGTPEQGRAFLGAYGSVEGRVETLTSRRRLRFTLYDSLRDQAVFCYLQQDQGELIRDAWGRRVIVRGWVRRDPKTGRPVVVSPVRSVDILPEVQPGSYRRARAVAPAGPDDPSPEVMIRRLRDA